MEEKTNNSEDVQGRIVKLENDLRAQEHRISVIVKNIIDYGFDNSDEKRRNAVWISLIGYLLSRQTATIIVGGLSTFAACIGIWLAWQANSLVKEQNKLIERQNIRLDQQTYLQESDRRSSLVFLMGSILEAIDKEIKDDVGRAKVRDLTPELIGRIVGITHILRPYKFMDGDSLISTELSPEKGQLLVSLLDSKIDSTSLNNIFQKADFSNSFLSKVEFSEIDLNYIKLDGSDLRDARFFNCNFSNAKISGVDFSRAFFRNCKFVSTNLWSNVFHNMNFDRCQFTNVYFWGSYFLTSHFSDCSFTNSMMNSCYFKNSDFFSSTFNNVSLREATIYECAYLPTLKDVIIDKKTIIDDWSYPKTYYLNLKVEKGDSVYVFMPKTN